MGKNGATGRPPGKSRVALTSVAVTAPTPPPTLPITSQQLLPSTPAGATTTAVPVVPVPNGEPFVTGGDYVTGAVGIISAAVACQRPSCGLRWWPSKSPHPSG